MSVGGYAGGALAGTSQGGTAGFVVQYDDSGNAQWERQLATGNILISSVAVDALGATHFCGYTVGDLFGPSAGGSDPIIGTYDASGNLTWGVQPGIPYGDQATDLTLDALGNIYVTGDMTGGYPGSPQFPDATLVKYDSVGQLMWRREQDLGDSDTGYSLAVDTLGNVFVTGTSGGDMFLSEYDSTGFLQWTVQEDNEGRPSIALDSNGNVIVATATGSGATGYTGTALRWYDSSGDLLLQQDFGPPGLHIATAIALDDAGNIYVAGGTLGDLGSPNAGGFDAFVSMLDPSGNLIWTYQFGGSGDEYCWDISVDTDLGVYVAGTTSSSLFAPNAGAYDAFALKIIPEPATLGLLALGACLPLFRRKRR